MGCPLNIQNISRILWKLKVHYCVHNSLPLFPIQRQMISVHTLYHYLCDAI